MRLTFILFALTFVFNFAISAQTNNNVKKTLKFDINKTIVNIEKISSQNLEVMLKASIIEKTEDDFYIIKDESGKMKLSLSEDQISFIGSYSEADIFYFTVKVKDFRKQTFTALKIKKAA